MGSWRLRLFKYYSVLLRIIWQCVLLFESAVNCWIKAVVWPVTSVGVLESGFKDSLGFLLSIWTILLGSI